MREVLITGVRAKTGAPLAALLSGRTDVLVRGGSGDPDQVRLAGVEPVAFSWDDALTWKPAIDGVDAVFVVRPDRADAPELIAGLLHHAPEAAHVVLLSEIDRGYLTEGHWALRTEQAVRDSGRTWTVLRPNWFMQVFSDPRFWLDDIVEHGRLPFPSRGESVSWIDAIDIAAVAAASLLEPGHDGQVHEITGPEPLTLEATARLLSAALGRPVEHVDITMEEALADSEGFTRDNDEGAFERIRLGLARDVSDTVERVTGRPARTFQEFLADEVAFVRT